MAEFAKAVRDDNPAHRDRAAAAEQGFAGIPAPLTFVAASAHWRRGPNPLAEHDLDLTRTLHGESEWEYARPLLAGEELTVHQDLAGIEEKQGRRAAPHPPRRAAGPGGRSARTRPRPGSRGCRSAASRPGGPASPRSRPGPGGR